MEVKALYGFTLLLILIGMILGVGVLTLDKFSTSVFTDTSGTTNNLVVWTNTNNATLTHSTVTASTLTAINQSGDTMTVQCDSQTKWSCTSITLVSPTGANGTALNVSYTYGADSASTDTLQAARGELSAIATTWLGLIVTVAILAIILTLVIRSFAGGMGRQ